jgi:hypothetical protein
MFPWENVSRKMIKSYNYVMAGPEAVGKIIYIIKQQWPAVFGQQSCKP